jgi:cell division protein FtsL
MVMLKLKTPTICKVEKILLLVSYVTVLIMVAVIAQEENINNKESLHL